MRAMIYRNRLRRSRRRKSAHDSGPETDRTRVRRVRTGTVFDNVGRRYSQGERWPTTVVTSRLGCTTSRFEHGRLDDTWLCVEQVCILVVNILTMSKMANSDASLRHAISLMSLSVF
jgi:hypothetical protein